MIALDIGLRATVIVLIALGAASALRRRSAALRHWVLAAGILSALAVAPLGIALPAWELPLQPAGHSPLTATFSGESLARPAASSARGAATLPAAPAGIAIATIVDTVWAAGIVIGFAGMLISLRRLSRLTAAARPLTDARWLAMAHALARSLDVRDDVALKQTGLATTLGTWGWRRPAVLLPAGCETWSDERIRIVLGHELAHIGRADWAIQMAADVVRAVFWYNPVFWLACARLRRESEAACDNAVLEAGVPASEYASHLLEIARTCRRPSPLATLVPMARRSTLEWRIAAMLNHTLIRTRPTRRALATVFAVIVGITLTTASFRAKEQAGPMPFGGTVYDVTSSVLPGVAVIMEDGNGNRATATTDRSGRFDFGVVAPGQYKLSTNIPGFMSVTHALKLEELRHWDVNLTLQVGTLQETVTVRDQRPAGASGRASLEPVKIGGNIKPPRKVVDVRPVYPAAMRDAGVEGIVQLNALIDTEGRVASVRPSGSQAHPELAKAAVEAVSQWLFTPTLLNGDKVEVLMTVAVAFTLQD
ncbi:MAG: TonB family protein [Vicinamibacterales bacterium]